MFDYQSDRHCTKTIEEVKPKRGSLITSQIDTAPKLDPYFGSSDKGLITSQIDTAPKRAGVCAPRRHGLITSQIDTAPKQKCADDDKGARLITSQIDTAPKPLAQIPHCKGRSNLTGTVL